MKTKCLVLIVSAYLLAHAYPAAFAEEKPVSDKIAVVNGTAIPRTEYLGTLNRMKQQYVQEGRPLDDAAVEKLKKYALDNLIGQELLFEECRSAGIQVEKSAVDTQLSSIKQQFPNEEAFRKALSERSLTMAMLESQIEKGFTIRKFIQERIVNQIKIGKTELQEFFDANPALFLQPEMVRASHILIKVEGGSDESQRAEADSKIKAIQKQLKEGKDFAEVARQLSEGPSRTQGGDLGFFRRGQMVPPFEQAAFALAPGAVSEKVVTRFGYHIIKVTDKKPAGTVSFAEAKDKIIQHLKQVKTDQEIKRYVEELKGKADIKLFN